MKGSEGKEGKRIVRRVQAGMGDKRRSSLLSLLRGRAAAPKEEKKKEPAAATAFERSVHLE